MHRTQEHVGLFFFIFETHREDFANQCVENMMIVESTAQNPGGCLRLDDGLEYDFG